MRHAPNASQAPDAASAVGLRIPELLRNNAALREDLQRTERELAEIQQRLQAVSKGIQMDREWRQAALNLIEDPVQARGNALSSNADLRKEIADRERAELALRESEVQLQKTVEQLQQLNAGFEQRVEERKRDLQNREQQLRELAVQISRIERTERQHLARVLHDHVQQLLIAAKMRVEVFAADLHDPQNVPVTGIVSILDNAIVATRDLSVQLTPPLLHDQGLPAALDWLISRVTKQQGLVIKPLIDAQANPTSDEARDILFQAAHEFLLNAAKHAKTRNVTLQLARGKQRIRLKVRDRGAGFDVAQTPASFGLFQLRQRLKSIGGKLTIASVPGRGTCAAATVRSQDTVSTRTFDPLPLPPLSSPYTEPAEFITVVLIDDHPLVREGLSQLLDRQADIKVVGEAANGALGVDLVLAKRPQVVIMDVHMPVMDGIEATRKILAEHPATKVIGLSFEQTPEINQSMLDAGASSYVTKDRASEFLVQAIREVATRIRT